MPFGASSSAGTDGGRCLIVGEQAKRALGAAMRNGHLHCSAGFRGATGAPVPSRSGVLTGCLTEVDRQSVRGTGCPEKARISWAPQAPAGSQRNRSPAACTSGVTLAHSGGAAGRGGPCGRGRPDRRAAMGLLSAATAGRHSFRLRAGIEPDGQLPSLLQGLARRRARTGGAQRLASSAGWRSCRASSEVRSWPPATTLDSRHESPAAFAQHGHPNRPCRDSSLVPARGQARRRFTPAAPQDSRARSHGPRPPPATEFHQTRTAAGAPLGTPHA